METSGLGEGYRASVCGRLGVARCHRQVFYGLIDLALRPVGNLQKKARDQIRGIVVGPGEDVCKQRIVKILAGRLVFKSVLFALAIAPLPRFGVADGGLL